MFSANIHAAACISQFILCALYPIRSFLDYPSDIKLIIFLISYRKIGGIPDEDALHGPLGILPVTDKSCRCALPD